LASNPKPRVAIGGPKQGRIDMANVLGAFGLKRWGTASSAPNFGFDSNPPFRIASGYGTAIYYGDLVRMNNSATGFVEQWANGDGSTATKILVGVFLGCRYNSLSQKKSVWNNYWPGSDANGDVEAFVCADPNSLWVAQAGGTSAATQTTIGQTVDVKASPTGSTTTGISGMLLDTANAGTSNVFPLKIVNLVTTPPGANGTDLTTANNYVIVAFNNQQYKALLGV